MNPITSADVFDFLTGHPPAPRSGAARVKKAVLNPGADPDADAALTRFRAEQKGVFTTPKVRDAVTEFRKALGREWADAELPLAEPIPDRPRVGWRDLFDRLMKYCRAEFGRLNDAPPTGSAELVVSSIISSYIRGEEAGRYGNLRDPGQLWPVLLEIAARKTGQPLTADVVAEKAFERAIETALEEAFRTTARDETTRLVFAHALLGKSPRDIAEASDDLEENVADVVRALHAGLHVALTAA